MVGTTLVSSWGSITLSLILSRHLAKEMKVANLFEYLNGTQFVRAFVEALHRIQRDDIVVIICKWQQWGHDLEGNKESKISMMHDVSLHLAGSNQVGGILTKEGSDKVNVFKIDIFY